jgi:hypothetical protein
LLLFLHPVCLHANGQCSMQIDALAINLQIIIYLFLGVKVQAC